MRNWLLAEEQLKINEIYGGYTPKYKHVHLYYQYTCGSNSPVEFDIIMENTNSSAYNDLRFGNGNYRLSSKMSYKSWTLEQLIEILPSMIYCDNEYNAVNIENTKNYHTLKLHIIKRRDENKDIDYMYKVMYKPFETKGI